MKQTQQFFLYLLKTIPLMVLLALVASGCKDPCKNINCENGGACVEGICECPPEFEGKNCEIVSITRYLGTYEASYTGCFTTPPGHTVSVDQVNDPGFSLQFIGLGDYQCPGAEPIRVFANATPTGVEIPEQTVCASSGFDGYRISGEGTKSGNTINLTFKAVYPADGTTREDNCTVTLIEKE